MNRAERRDRAYRIALRRLLSMPNKGRGQILGWFRKWNSTCDCKICKAAHEDSKKIQKIKDYRRNPVDEFEDYTLNEET